MATFTETTHLYEILVRVLPDGTFAAQYQTISEVLKDGQVISATVNDVKPLTDDPEALAIVAGLLGRPTSETVAQNESLVQAVALLESQNETLQAAVSSLTAQLAEIDGDS